MTVLFLLVALLIAFLVFLLSRSILYAAVVFVLLALLALLVPGL